MNALTLLLFSLIVTTSTYAFPKAPFNALNENINHHFNNNRAQEYDFEAIVKLSNCSGSVIRFKGQPLESNAYVLTNGHCLNKLSFLKPGKMIVDMWTNRTMRVFDGQMKKHRIKAKRISYATMSGTDSALYRLKETYLDLEKKNIRAFILSDQRPNLDTAIEIVSGYWERGYSCSIDQFVYQLQEGDWLFNDSIRYSDTGCQVVGGTSGSPIIEKGTRIVIGVNNTGNESGKKCEVNNPCEIDMQKNITVTKGASYGQQTYQFYECLNEQFEIDLSLDNCALTR